MRAFYRRDVFMFTVSEILQRADVSKGWDHPGVFRADYLAGPEDEVKWRKEVIDYLHMQRGSETFRSELLVAQPKLRHVQILTAYHTCTDMDTALGIIATGPVALSRRDEGFFSRGFYLSPDLGHSVNRYHDKESGTATVLCCDVVVGGALYIASCIMWCVSFGNVYSITCTAA